MAKKTAELTYEGDLRTRVVHLKSGNALVTDAPVDNHGKGEAFSPTDLLAVSMITCMVTVMGIHAEKTGLKIGEVSGWVEKIMAEHPRRVAQLNIEITFKNHRMDASEKRRIQEIGLNCPVAKSVHPDLLTQVKFIYQ
ncbi:MAG: OsmC family protein [Bacteroidia bacterium]|nr:OsmC family protein [Bacteroidia bacterium]